MVNKVKLSILKGRHPIGTFFEIMDANAVECLGLAGLDFFIIDTEHSPYGASCSADLIRAARVRDITPFARAQEASRAAVLKLLDAGAQGVIVPNIETAAQARSLVEYAKYFPSGRRGLAFGREAGWGEASIASGPLSEYFRICNEETMLLPQCETRGCLESIEEIASISGVDGIFVGPFDLSGALGRPGDYATDEFNAALNRILSACRAAGKPCMIYAPDSDTAVRRLRAGFDAVAISMDTTILTRAVRSMVHAVQSAL